MIQVLLRTNLYLADLYVIQWRYWSACVITAGSAAESTNTVLSPPQHVSTQGIMCFPQGFSNPPEEAYKMVLICHLHLI